jgi:hypothetical protein
VQEDIYAIQGRQKGGSRLRDGTGLTLDGILAWSLRIELGGEQSKESRCAVGVVRQRVE